MKLRRQDNTALERLEIRLPRNLKRQLEAEADRKRESMAHLIARFCAESLRASLSR